MSPSEPQTMEQPTILINGQALPAQPESVHTTQPQAAQPMGTLHFQRRRLGRHVNSSS